MFRVLKVFFSLLFFTINFSTFNIPAQGELYLKQIIFVLGTAGFLLSCDPPPFAIGTITP
jgi:hypothetical protein